MEQIYECDVFKAILDGQTLDLPTKLLHCKKDLNKYQGIKKLIKDLDQMAINNFKNIIVHYKDETSEEDNVNNIKVKELNDSWLGMLGRCTKYYYKQYR